MTSVTQFDATFVTKKCCVRRCNSLRIVAFSVNYFHFWADMQFLLTVKWNDTLKVAIWNRCNIEVILCTYHMQSKITECWLAETEGIFFLNQEGMITWCWLAEHACIELVPHLKRILKRNFRNASLLSLISTQSFHLNVKENQHATKCSLLVEKQKNFSDQKRIDSQPENSLSGDGWCK